MNFLRKRRDRLLQVVARLVEIRPVPPLDVLDPFLEQAVHHIEVVLGGILPRQRQQRAKRKKDRDQRGQRPPHGDTGEKCQEFRGDGDLNRRHPAPLPPGAQKPLITLETLKEQPWERAGKLRGCYFFAGGPLGFFLSSERCCDARPAKNVPASPQTVETKIVPPTAG